MAEWLSTDFFQQVIRTARRRPARPDASVEQNPDSLAYRSGHVRDGAQGHEKSECENKKQFRSDQLAHEIKLQNNDCGKANTDPHFRLLRYRIQPRPNLAQHLLHQILTTFLCPD